MPIGMPFFLGSFGGSVYLVHLLGRAEVDTRIKETSDLYCKSVTALVLRGFSMIDQPLLDPCMLQKDLPFGAASALRAQVAWKKYRAMNEPFAGPCDGNCGIIEYFKKKVSQRAGARRHLGCPVRRVPVGKSGN
jgi:hypothetical protein